MQETSLRTAFSVNILPTEDIDIHFGRTKTVVYIEEGGLRTGVTFPLNPKVVSLMDYDNTNGAREQPSQGYPLVCVTVCVSINIFQYFNKNSNFCCNFKLITSFGILELRT